MTTSRIMSSVAIANRNDRLAWNVASLSFTTRDENAHRRVNSTVLGVWVGVGFGCGIQIHIVIIPSRIDCLFPAVIAFCAKYESTLVSSARMRTVQSIIKNAVHSIATT